MGQTPWVESLRSPNSSNITSLRTMNASPSPPSNGGTCVGLALVDGRNGQLTSWCGLLQALETRFATSTYEDPTITLFKLMQHGSVNDYLSEFETLANRIIGFQLTSWNVVGFFFFFFFLLVFTVYYFIVSFLIEPIYLKDFGFGSLQKVNTWNTWRFGILLVHSII